LAVTYLLEILVISFDGIASFVAGYYVRAASKEKAPPKKFG
jgi:hypothetical protein